jgi:hypothetical protein
MLSRGCACGELAYQGSLLACSFTVNRYCMAQIQQSSNELLPHLSTKTVAKPVKNDVLPHGASQSGACGGPASPAPIGAFRRRGASGSWGLAPPDPRRQGRIYCFAIISPFFALILLIETNLWSVRLSLSRSTAQYGYYGIRVRPAPCI